MILVNEKDEVNGSYWKNGSASKRVAPRAFSVFIFNAKGEMLLQQRAMKNTIAVAYGPMPVAAIPSRVKKQSMLRNAG